MTKILKIYLFKKKDEKVQNATSPKRSGSGYIKRREGILSNETENEKRVSESKESTN